MEDANSVAQRVLNTFSFDQEKKTELVTFEAQISAWEDKSNQMLNIPMNDIKTIQDKDFLDAAFKSLVKVGMKGLEKMENDLKLGAPAKDKEALAMMQSSVTETLVAMSQYHIKLKEMEMFQVLPPQQTNVQNIFNVEASSSDMMDLVENAKARSELKGIKAEFRIDTEKSY